MGASSDVLAFASEILAFLGFLATCIAVMRYLNPGTEYIVLADLADQVRRIWIEHEREGFPTDECTILFLSTLERLEDDVRDLLFVMNKKSIGCQIRAWANSFRIKTLSKRAQLLRIGLPLVIQMNKGLYEAQRNTALMIEDLVVLEKMYRSRAEFMRLIEADVNSDTEVQIPPVPWTPSRGNLLLRRSDTTFSSEGGDTLVEPVTPPDTVVSQKTANNSEVEDLETGTLSNPKKRRLLKKLFSGVRNKRNSYDSGLTSCSV